MKSTTVDAKRPIFLALFDLPDQLGKDNGPQFTGHEFAIFVNANGIQHIHN